VGLLVAKRDHDPHADVRLAPQHVEVELHARVVQEPSASVRARVTQAALIEFEVGVVPDALDEAINGKQGRVEAVFGALDLVFDGRRGFL
jgi:hypothetical protein